MVNNISLCKWQSIIGKLIFCSPEGLINKPLNAKNILKALANRLSGIFCIWIGSCKKNSWACWRRNYCYFFWLMYFSRITWLIMQNYYIPFFIALILFRFKELGKAIKIKQNILMEIIYLLLTITQSVLLYIYIKQI
jgi:hypothetical protein